MRFSIPILAGVLIHETAANAIFPGRVITRDESLKRYDYVVIGGGTSGLVVANRLSENPSKL